MKFKPAAVNEKGFKAIFMKFTPAPVNEKGQTSMVFQLLIAAVVTVAVLGVLMYILKLIPEPSAADPKEKAVELMKMAADDKGQQAVHSDKASFSTENKSIFIGNLAKQVPRVTDARICFGSTGMIADDGDFTITNRKISYDAIGSGSREVMLMTACYPITLRDSMEDDLSDAAGRDEIVPTSDCCDFDSGLCCMLIVDPIR